MKKLLFSLLILCSFMAKAQVYNNEWIDYSKTYYKFKVGKTGLYRIPQATLTTAGLSSALAQDFQLWRNGEQIPIYTSVATGSLAANDYIEFWGRMNDGKPDKQLYRSADYQLNDYWSLETDTATYFLTVNPGGNNLRLTPVANNIAGNTLMPEPYFMYTLGQYFRDRINYGYAVNVGEYVYSSSYDKGEGFASNDIGTGATNAINFPNLYVYNSGPAATFTIALSGNAVNARTYRVKINSDSIIGGSVDNFDYTRGTASVAVSTLASGAATIQVTNAGTQPNDRMVVHQYELTYPRTFNFGGAKNFEFTLPANAISSYLEITNFSYGSTAPVLYDLTNGKQYVTDISAAPTVKVVLQPSATERKLVIVSEEAANINAITPLQPRNFVNYGLSNNQADYIIISNPILANTTGANPVEDYRAYRSSAAGGSYNAKVYMVDDVIDQFGFGIKMNPLGLRNFLLFARQKFSSAPKHVFLIGKGVNYMHQRINEGKADISSLNLVPTFGWPASDVLLTAIPGSSEPQISIGRLSAIYPQEVAVYLKKIKDFEQAQKTGSPSIVDKAWMKNVVHLVGSNDPTLQSTLDAYMSNYNRIISDTLFGGRVTTFSKTSADEIQQATNGQLQNLFSEGLSLITYFGHSSSGALAFNLDNPENYNNPKKYPLFIALGCDAGDFYNYNTLRFQTKETVSESFVLAQDRGTMGFIASTSLGVIYYLDILNSRIYKSMTSLDYGKPIGIILKDAVKSTLDFTTQDDFYGRITGEQIALNGDPAAAVNSFAKPDYVIEDPLVQITPTPVSITSASVNVKAKFLNIGKAINQNIVVSVTRQYPNGTSQIVVRDTIPGIRYADSISFDLPISAIRDKGSNKITVTVDADNQVDELYETNNTVTKEFLVYENEARPVYPYNFSIVNKQNTKVVASTANPFVSTAQYKMEMDTTELFNSPLKVTKTITSSGGVLEFDPGLSYTDSTVYYWHTGFVSDTGSINWSSASSFLYLSNHAPGANQSHKFQHMKSTYTGIYVDSTSGKFLFTPTPNDLFIRNAVYPISGPEDPDYYVTVNGVSSISGGCSYNEIIFNVFDSLTFRPWKNSYSGSGGLYNSLNATCGPRREFNFEYLLSSSGDRKKAMDFLDQIPAGSYVIARTNTNPNGANTYASVWKADTALFGSNNSLYHRLLQQGIATIDSFNRPRALIWVFRKNMQNSFTPLVVFSSGIYDKITLGLNVSTPGYNGIITSPVFGPAKAWKEYSWKGATIDASTNGDSATVNIIGIRLDGSQATVLNNITPGQQTLNIANINAAQYPYLQLQMLNKDSLYHTPYQLNYWRLSYDPVPEGALAPNLYFSMKDTIAAGDNVNFKVAFKNVSDVAFDSVRVKLVLTNNNNVATTIQDKKYKPLAANDTLQISQPINSQALAKGSSLYVDVNPEDNYHQPEQYHFNNFGYKNFYVASDTLNPLLDVTFDNTHILNHDLISSKPNIIIKLQDESKYALLNDTSLVNVQVKYPNGSLKSYRFDNDTLQFTAATQGAANNTATVSFKPYFTEDGDYELIVSGKDKANNPAGNTQYRVAFQIINKAMISNMLNYPNPFTTATAFVFTITGSEVPQNIRIQILTITGKIVREITKEELGPLHIGRNITEFKWDGTDQYGQKVANGVYLYRVLTNLNGKALDKYKADTDNTDKYFNKGYGKMYLMR